MQDSKDRKIAHRTQKFCRCFLYFSAPDSIMVQYYQTISFGYNSGRQGYSLSDLKIK
jgi:hypothetical protein